MQLLITLRFAERRYHGRRSETHVDFPPSPSRLFQSLIAGSHCGVYGLMHSDERDLALKWLESLPPPAIQTPIARESGRGVTNYVPNNDNKLEHIRTAKGFVANVFQPEHALIYRWRFEASPEAQAHATTIGAMTKLITHLGQHQDVVYASSAVTEDEVWPEDAMLPDEQSDGDWVAPEPGALAAYQERYRVWLSGGNKDNVTIPVRRTHYRAPGTLRFDAPLALFEMWCDEDERKRFDPRAVRQPAAMVRHALIEWSLAHPKFIQHYGQELAERLIAGHEADRQHDGAHIACVPLPSLQAEGKADGWLRRVLLIGYGCENAVARELFESVADGINGAPLNDRGKPVGYLKKAALSDGVFRQFVGKGQRVWRTVTPIILTGLMRRGRGAEVLVVRALKQAGVPEDAIDSVAVFSGPIVPKTVHALDYQIERSSYLAQTPRYHAEVIFKRPVEGLLVIGRGRHCGFGLMMPCLENSPNYPFVES